MLNERTIIQLKKEIADTGVSNTTFRKKPITGVNTFWDTRTGERYTTHSNGYVRRTTPGGRNAPINPRRRIKGQFFDHYEIIKIDTEESRLRYLLEYFKRKNVRFKKNGTKYYGAPEPKDVKLARLEMEWDVKKKRTASIDPIRSNLNTMRQATQRILDKLIRYELNGDYDVKKESFDDVNEVVRLTGDLLVKMSDFKK